MACRAAVVAAIALGIDPLRLSHSRLTVDVVTKVPPVGEEREAIADADGQVVHFVIAVRLSIRVYAVGGHLTSWPHDQTGRRSLLRRPRRIGCDNAISELEWARRA